MEGSASRTANNNSRKYILTLPPTIISIIYLVLTCLLQLNLVFSLHARWHDFIKRLITFKDIGLTLFCSLSFIRLMRGDTTQLCKYIEEHVSSINIDKELLSDRQNSIILNREHKFETNNKIVKRYFYILTTFACILPALKSFKAALIENYLNKRAKFHFILSIHYPEEYKSLLLDMTIQTLLVVWYVAFAYYWVSDLKAMSLSFQFITTEMELLRNSLEDMDSIVEKSLAIPEKIINDNSKNTVLQSHISGIVMSHQSICRRVEFFNNNMKNLLVFLMNIYAIQLCLFLAIIVDGKKLRDALWMCAWTDKPSWLKKSLLIMMTRATVDLQIKPYNLYPLDLSCFTLIVKGSYSYFNIYKDLRK